MSAFEWMLGTLWSTLLIGLIAILLFLWYTSRNHGYWKKAGLPFAKPLPLIGSMWEFFKWPLHEVEYKRYFQLGRIYGHYEGNAALISVGDPSLLRDILVKDFHVFTNRRKFATGDRITDNMLSILQGEDWKRVRNIITPTFSTGKIKRVMSIFRECSQTLLQNFTSTNKEGKPIDAKRMYGAFSMDVIASSAFSTKIDSHNDPDNQFVRTARSIFLKNGSWRFILFIVAPKLMKYLGVSVFGRGVMNFFIEVTHQIMEERKRTGQVRNDFLQLLMDTAKELDEDSKNVLMQDKDDVTSNYGAEDINPQIFKNVTSKNLSMDELVAQCVIFFIAGYDTTASTMAFVTYLLALHPDVQDKVRQEVDMAIRENNGELTYEGIQSMKYLDNIISETLRLYPPIIRLERVAETDYKLGETGTTIKKKMLVTIPVYAMHRDPEFFPDPDKFDPERFNTEEKSKRISYSYLPFGAGPRNCVGMRFALIEIKVGLAHVLAHFFIKRCPQTKVPLDFYHGQGLLQPKEIIVQLEERKDKPLSV